MVMGSTWNGLFDPIHTDELAWTDATEVQALEKITDVEAELVKDTIAYVMKRPSASMTLAMMVGLSLIQSQHHIGSKALTTAMSTALKITTGISQDLPSDQTNPASCVYKTLHDALHVDLSLSLSQLL